ncbi:hypothetical protein K1719_030095 [Acacia pycnantha]|nr:hypothetical protein K1719_030095 [Acacia pycnantha]
MHTRSHILSSNAFSNFFFFFFLSLLTVPQSMSQEDDPRYIACKRNYNCGYLNVPYPFWAPDKPRYCGREGFEAKCHYCGGEGFEAKCHSPDNLSIRIASQNFTIARFYEPRNKIRMVRTGIPSYDNCSFHFSNTSLDSALFNIYPDVTNMTLFYDCVPGFSIGQNNFTCRDDIQKQGFFVDQTQSAQFTELSEHCRVQVQVPVTLVDNVDPFGGIEYLQNALDYGFNVLWEADWTHCLKCKESGGVCGSVDNGTVFNCYCRNGSYPFVCPGLASFTSVAIGAILICIVIICCKAKSLKQKIGFWKTSKVDQKIEAFIKNQEPLALTRYRFADIKKMTKSFQVKLGQGGHGIVYKGELLNGCPVAVKILNPSKGNGEEFINEVASICRTSHINIITLLGFCLEGQKKALIYEFMCNGSLEKLIRNREIKTNSSLTWENLYQIVFETARGLEYLHKGCNTQILHFDIKPHNILLDEKFCPKITDFGLAKLCPSRKSIISLAEARGTFGYLAPEVWNRNIGGVSCKCDVYSYGVMLLDIAGVQKDVTIDSNYPIENYVLGSVYDKLEQSKDLGQNGVNMTEQNDFAKKITIVGLWCMQTFPTQRPTMSRVIEMLEGSLDLLQMPPKPVMPSVQEEK